MEVYISNLDDATHEESSPSIRWFKYNLKNMYNYLIKIKRERN